MFDDVCRHGGGMRRRAVVWTNVCCCVLLLHDGVIVVDGIVLMCVVTSGGGNARWLRLVFLYCSSLMVMYDDVVIQGLIVVIVDLMLLGERNLIQEELISSLHATGTIYSFYSCAG